MGLLDQQAAGLGEQGFMSDAADQHTLIYGHGVLSSHLLVVYPVSRHALTMAVLKPRAAVKVSIRA